MKNILIIGSIALSLTISILAYNNSRKLGAFPTDVSSGDTITSTDWNLIQHNVTDTNAYDVTYSGKLTITSASTTNQTISNLWNTTGNITTLTATGGTITNASTTRATLPTFWGTTGTVGTLTISSLFTAATSTLGGTGSNVIVASTTNAYNIGLIIKGGGLQIKGYDSTACYTIKVANGSVLTAATSTCQ